MSNVMPRRRKDGSIVYRVRVRRLGICISRTFPTKAEAGDYAGRMERDLLGRTPAEIETLAGLIDRYVEISPVTGRERLRYWSEKIGHLRLAEVTPAVVRAHRDSLSKEYTCGGYNHRTTKLRTPATIRKYLHALSAAFRFAISELNWPLDNPVAKVSKPRSAGHRVRFLSEQERAALIAAARESPSETLYAAVLISLTTGLRRGELHALEWSDIDLQYGHALIRRSKNGTARGVPLTGQAIAALSALPRKEGRVFAIDLSKAFRSAISTEIPLTTSHEKSR